MFSGRLQRGPNALVLVIIMLFGLTIALPTDLLPEDVSMGGRDKVGHTESHSESQLACSPDDSSLKQFSLTAQYTDWEFTLGGTIDAWTFDGIIPAPLLCANLGDTIEVSLTNTLEVPVSFHVHLNPPEGVVNPEQVAPEQTGVFSFLADQAGTYLYHDLANGNEGTGRGLHGALIVRDGIPEVDHEIVVILGEYQPDYHPDTYAAIVNGFAFPYLPAWNFELGERVQVHLLNIGPSEEHTFHIHGHRWIDSDEGRPIDNKFLSPHSAVYHPEISRPEGFIPLASALVDDVSVFAFDADSAGEWMYHCHIYDHINAGMMGHLEVQEVE